MKAPTQLDQDTLAVLIWCKHNAAPREISYRDIAAGIGLAHGSHRLQQAVRQARIAAEHSGHRLERFYRSHDPARRGEYVTRFNLSGRGDEHSSRDAMFTSRAALVAMHDARRSNEYESKNVNSVAREAFGDIASITGGCITMMTGVTGLGKFAHDIGAKYKAVCERMSQLEAELAEARGGTTEGRPASAAG